MIKIVKGDEVIVQNNLIITIYGDPGVGKTSLGFSADKPLLLDFDNGAQRSIGRKDAVVIKDWKDIKDISADDLKEYNTIVIDTVGKLCQSISEYLMKEEPKLRTNRGTLTLPGFGALGATFNSFMSKMKSFNKDIVLIGHVAEDKDGDQIIKTVASIGKSREEILRCSDLLGYVQTQNNKPVLNFNPTDTSKGKNCAQFDVLVVPLFAEQQNFMADIIKKAKNFMNAKSAEQIKKEGEFNAAVDVINCAVEPEEFTTLIPLVKDNAPLKAHLHKTATETKGYIYDPEIKAYKKRIVAIKEKTQSNVKEEIEADICVEPNSGEVME